MNSSDTPPEQPPQLIPSSPQPQVVYATPYIQQQTSGAAIASFICGIVGMFGCCCCPMLLAALAAVICGHIAISQINRNSSLQGKPLAIIGLVLGYLAIVIQSLILILGVASPEFSKQMQENIEKAKKEFQKAEAPLPKDAS